MFDRAQSDSNTKLMFEVSLPDDSEMWLVPHVKPKRQKAKRSGSSLDRFMLSLFLLIISMVALAQTPVSY